jgi:hypothetical protein
VNSARPERKPDTRSNPQGEYMQKAIIGNDIGRRYEIWFKNTQWKLTDSNGRTGCAQFTMENFFYTKLINQHELDCVEHNLEIGLCKVQDLTSESKSDTCLTYQSDANRAEKNMTMIRLICKVSTILLFHRNYQSLRCFKIHILKERPPVGEIPVIDHLELNLAPLTIKLTQRFYTMIETFFFKFDDKPTDNKQFDVKSTAILHSTNRTNDDIKVISSSNYYISSETTQSASYDANRVPTAEYSQNSVQTQKFTHKKSKSNNFILINSNSLANLQDNDVEIMKQRSANNKTFIRIKIPEIPLLVSYKGNKENNIKDLNNVSLKFPLFEVYNKTCTWLDLINDLKSHLKKALLSQAIEYKIKNILTKPVNIFIPRTKNQKMMLADSNLKKKIDGKFYDSRSSQVVDETPSKSLLSPGRLFFKNSDLTHRLRKSGDKTEEDNEK